MTTKPYGLELLLDLKGCDLLDLSREKLTEYFIKLCELIQVNRNFLSVYAKGRKLVAGWALSAVGKGS